MNRRDCIRCAVEMEIGFVNDRDSYSGGPNHWLEGPPERTWLGSLKFRGKRYLEIVTFRCPECGMLEMVAPDPSETKAIAKRGAVSLSNKSAAGRGEITEQPEKDPSKENR
jgi:hypothetical protein